MFSCGQFGNFENWDAMLIWQPRSQTTHLWALADLQAATSAVWINKTLLYKGARLRRGKHHPLLLTASKSIEFGSMQPARRGRPSIATNAESESPGLIKVNRPRFWVGGLKSRSHPVMISSTARRCGESSSCSEESLPFCTVANRLLVRKRFGQIFSFAHFQEEILEICCLSGCWCKSFDQPILLERSRNFIVNTECCKVLYILCVFHCFHCCCCWFLISMGLKLCNKG